MHAVLNLKKLGAKQEPGAGSAARPLARLPVGTATPGATTKAAKSACKKQAGRHAVICPQVGCGPK